MAIDLKAIDRKIKKLQRLKEFAQEFGADPEFPVLLAEFTNGNGSKPEADKSTRLSPINGDGSKARGYLLTAVHNALAAITGDFTSQDIETSLKAAGFQFKAKPNVAINEVLRALEIKKFVHKIGKKGVQIVWRKTVFANSAVGSRTA